jgi:putative acetyltransferase
MPTIRSIEQKDNSALAKIIRDIFVEFDAPLTGTVYSDPDTDTLYEVFQQPGSTYFLAEEAGVVLGGCGIYPTKGLPEGCAELVKFYLSPAARGKGLGKLLIDKVVAAAPGLGYKQLYLESFPQLAKAVSMYEKAGFRILDQPMGESGHYATTLWMLMDL